VVGGAWNVARTRATHEKEAHKKDGTLTFDDLWRHFFGHDFSHAMGWAWTHTLHITHHTLHITHYTFDEYGTHIFEDEFVGDVLT